MLLKADLIDSIGLEFPFEWLLLLLFLLSLDLPERLLLFDEDMGLKFLRKFLILSDVLSFDGVSVEALLEALPEEPELSASTSLLSLILIML